MTLVWCKTHKRNELVPSENYDTGGFSYWYARGWHPRFIVRQVVSQALGNNAYYAEVLAVERQVIAQFFSEPVKNGARKRCPTRQQVFRFARQRQLHTLYHQGRRHRVSTSFLTKF